MKNNKGNKVLFSCLIIIMIISLLGLSNFDNYLLKQVIWLIIGLIFLIIIKNFNIKIIIKYSFLIYLINVLLLVLVLIIGRNINGSKAWFSLGPLAFQPSELMRISLSLIYYKIIKDKNKYLTFKIILLFIVPCILVFLEPDTGAIIMYLIIMLVALFNSNSKRFIILFVFLGIILSVGFIILYKYNPDLIIKYLGTSIFYRVDRIINFKDNYQLNQALIYIGSAGLFGHKKVLYIPEAHTDFIFSFIMGRYGILLGFVILISYLIIDFILINKSKKNLLTKFFFYTFLYSEIQNILMNLGLLPIMGIPLFFLSYGGTSTIINMLFLGLCLNKKNNY